MRTYEYYINSFIANVEVTKNIDYSNYGKVRKNNLAADNIRKIASKIDLYYPDKINNFSQLLHSEDPKVRSWCAVCLLECMHYNEQHENEAINEIKRLSETEFGFVLWLKNWEAGKVKTVYNIEKSI